MQVPTEDEMRFLSTPSARRATLERQVIAGRRHQFLSTPSARRATQSAHAPADAEKFLSTPSARRATGAVASTTTPKIFLSTPSARRATAVDYEPQQPLGISIHALREEGDASTSRPARS